MQALVEAQPLELVIGNIVRRILFIIRGVHAAKLREMHSSHGQGSEGGGDGGLPPQQPSLSLSDEGASVEEQLGVAVPNLRTTVMDAIGDLRCEVGCSGRSVFRCGGVRWLGRRQALFVQVDCWSIDGS